MKAKEHVEITQSQCDPSQLVLESDPQVAPVASVDLDLTELLLDLQEDLESDGAEWIRLFGIC
jgi:hypothetical protein